MYGRRSRRPVPREVRPLLLSLQKPKPFAVQAGSSGVLAFCNRNKDQLAKKELLLLLNEYADQLYGEERPESAANGEAAVTKTTAAADDDDEDDDDEEEVGIEDAFAKEMGTLKKPKKTHRFSPQDVGIDCTIFIKAGAGIDPKALVGAILKDLDQTKKKKTRFTQRILPIEQCSAAFLADIITLAKKIVVPQFPSDSPVKYSIVFNRRFNDQISRDELIPKLAELVGPAHQVDIKNPDRVILVEIFKGICGMSVVDDFYKYKKYNLEAVFDQEAAQNMNKRKRGGDAAAGGAKEDSNNQEVKRVKTSVQEPIPVKESE
ncbi:hypothetical protein DFJ73DRAFT_336881 [Zopfochytrium polystomum]|nr:hypothetical protein DFJ73DRAFT_336881 [Zopfochytrium polystomum]